MAATIRLVTFSGQTVTPKNDAIVYDASIGKCGVFYGCDVTASGNVIYVSSGYGMIRGRFFEIEASTLSVTLSSTDTLLGRVYVRLDLSNTESPVQLLTVTGSSLPALEQDADANFTDGVWEMELATFTVTTTEVSGVVETYETITDNGTLINALQSSVSALNTAMASVPKILVERVANIGSPYTFDLSTDDSNHGTYLVTVRRYGGESFDGTYWIGIASRLSSGGTNKWALNMIATNSNSAYSVTMSGRSIVITNGTGSNNYAYICITRLG